MRNDLTDVTIILDRSGSMETRVNETISGFNEFLQDQRSGPGEVTFSLVQFDHDITPTITALPLDAVKPLDTVSYRPRGFTALREAMCKTIDAIGVRLANTPESQRPGRVLVVVITDGLENHSRAMYTPALVAQKVRHQEQKYNWTFQYIGTNQDSIVQAGELGIEAGNAMNYSAQATGALHLFKGLSGAVKGYRSMDPGKHESAMGFAAVQAEPALATCNVDKVRPNN